MTHWASSFIGLPYETGGQGPDAFDCWGFFRYVQDRHYGRELPEVGLVPASLRAQVQEFEGNPERQHWHQVERPQEGDAVLMARRRMPVHIGVWITANGTGGVLHCMQGPGVVFMSPAGLRGAGWGRLTYYRHHPCTP